MVVDIVVEAGITQHAKKSIFPTTEAGRENTFFGELLMPLVKKKIVEQAATGGYACGAPAKFRFDNTGFEMHSPHAPEHDSGGLEVETVEGHYKEKLDNLLSDETDWNYDAILDNSMAFWINDLSTLVGYNEDSIDRIYLEWESPNIKNNDETKTYYSLIVLNKANRADMNIYEFISDTFSTKDDYGDDIKFIKSEPRAHIEDNTDSNANYNADYDYKAICEANGYEIMELGIRRAVSDIEANIDWYIEVFEGSIVDIEKQIERGEFIDINGNQVKYAHIMPQQDDSFSISFFQRIGDKDTYGDFSISKFEDELNKAHSNVMVNPFCCVDRWYDMHYALPLNSDIAAARTLENIMSKEGQLYTVYEITKPGGENIGKGMFWTMVEPNGQVLQLQGPETTSNEVSIEFVTQPSYWDGQWCPQENTDEFEQYEFGDKIATIVVKQETRAHEEGVAAGEAKDDEPQNQEQEQEQGADDELIGKEMEEMEEMKGEANVINSMNNNGDNSSNKGINHDAMLVTLLVPVLIVLSWGCVYFLTSDKWVNRNGKNSENKSTGDVSFTYKTF